MKYRIKEVSKGSSIHYVVQRKFLFWWIDSEHKHLAYSEATDEIAKETQVSVKYHEVDINNLGIKFTYRNEKGEETTCPFDFSKMTLECSQSN